MPLRRLSRQKGCPSGTHAEPGGTNSGIRFCREKKRGTRAAVHQGRREEAGRGVELGGVVGRGPRNAGDGRKEDGPTPDERGIELLNYFP
jgi:hypothetical protein